MQLRSTLGWGALSAALVALGAAATVHLAGRSIRSRSDPLLDDPLDPPEDLTHHRLQRPDGAVIHVVDTGGAGPPVVLMHGVTLQWWVWAPVIRLLRAKHRVLAWDMRGHGESLSGSDGVSLEACAGDLAALLDGLDLREAVIVGHSMGGMILGRFLVQHPEVVRARVAGLQFLATSGSAMSRSGVAGGLVELTGFLASLTRAGMRFRRLRYTWPDGDLSAVLVRAAFGPRATSRMIDDVRRMVAEVDPLTLLESGRSIAAHDVIASLGTADVPTIVVVGLADRLTPAGHARALVAAISGSELRLLPGIGHQVMQEAPEEVVDAVRAVSVRATARA